MIQDKILWSEDVEKFVRSYVPNCYTLSTIERTIIKRKVVWHAVFIRKGSCNIYYIMLFPERDCIKINVTKIETERYKHCIHLKNLTTGDIMTIKMDLLDKNSLGNTMYDFLSGSMVEIIK